MVAAVAQKLIEQVAIGAMDFDGVETRRECIFSRMTKTCDNAGQLIIAEFARNLVGLLALRCMGLVVGYTQWARRHGLSTVVQQRMTSAATMPDLQRDPTSLGVNRSSDFFPAGHLRG